MRQPFALAQHHVTLARGTRVVLLAPVQARDGYLCKAGTVGRVEVADHPRYAVTTPGGRTIDCARDQLVIQKQRLRASAGRQSWDWDRMRGHVVLSVVVGSRAWNLADEASDTDRKGVFLLPFEAASGLWQPPDEIRAPDTDAQYWEVRKVIDQGLRGDANTLEMLWSPHVERADAAGELLRRERDIFVSKRIYNAFGRYAISQFEKIGQKLRHVELLGALRADAQASPARPRAEVEVALVRAGLCRDAKAAHTSVERQVDSLFDRGLIAERAWPAAQAWLAQLDAAVWEAEATYRPKNAYNLLRLLHSGLHWLSAGEPLIAIEAGRPDGLRERLMAIKRGEVPIEEVLAEAHALAARFEQAWEASDLPDEGDADAANALLRACRAHAARRHFALPDARALEPDPEPVPLRAPRFALPEHALRAFLARYAHLDPVVLSVTGAHNFGFPSPDSDVDLKGVHMLPLAAVLRAQAPPETVDFLGFVDLPDGQGATLNIEADYTSHDARKAVGLLLRGNGNILEVLHSPYQLLPGPDAHPEAHRRLEALRALSLANLGTHYARHYQGFFANKRRDFERDGALKALLYAYRIALTGIHLMREADVLPDLGRLIDLYPRWRPTVAPLIDAKLRGVEKMTAADALDPALLQAAGRDLDALDAALSEAVASSPLPSAPPDPDAFDAWLACWRTTPTPGSPPPRPRGPARPPTPTPSTPGSRAGAPPPHAEPHASAQPNPPTPLGAPMPALPRTLCLAPAALAVLGALGCDAAERLDNFNVDVREQVTVPGASVLEQLLGGFPQLDDLTTFNRAETSSCQNSKYSPDDVDSVVLESLTFTVVSPSGQDLAFLGEVIFYVQADGLERKELARQDTFPPGVSQVAFDTTPDDLKRYLLAREADITVEALDSRRPNQDTVIEVEAIFDVDVNVF